MDNGLIFPYRRRTAHAEVSDAKRLKPHSSFGMGVGGTRDPDW